MAPVGLASPFGKNPPFLPNGSVFTRMIAERPGEQPFGAHDLYAAYLLLDSSKRMGFGRGETTARRQTKFLYYFVHQPATRCIAEGAATIWSSRDR
jgi:hypothetical protein